MILALVIFAVTYLLMLALPKERPWVALCSAAVFMALGQLGVYDFSLSAALGAVDYNVLLMMSGTMGIVSLFIRSRMPARLAEQLIVRVPNAQWAVCVLALFAGVISAFVDNVATVLMVAPVGLIIAIAVSSNLQGAATLVGDTTSILLGGFAEMNFFDFFWMHGRPGVFWGVELGALTSLLVLLWLLMKPLNAIVTRLPLVSTVNGLGGAALGLVCGGLTLFVVVWAMQRFGWLITPELVEKTTLLKFFATHTPLGLLATL